MSHWRSRRRYWADRFRWSRGDVDEARSLLLDFAGLARDDTNADATLTRYVAGCVRRWAVTGFAADAAPAAFKVAGQAAKRGRPPVPGTAERHAAAIAEVYRRRLAGDTLPIAFDAASRSLASSSIREIYERAPIDVRTLALLQLTGEEQRALVDLLGSSGQPKGASWR